MKLTEEVQKIIREQDRYTPSSERSGIEEFALAIQTAVAKRCAEIAEQRAKECSKVSIPEYAWASTASQRVADAIRREFLGESR